MSNPCEWTTRLNFTVVGNYNAGKTTLVQGFVQDAEVPFSQATAGIDYFYKQLDHPVYGRLEFRGWDTSGTPKFNTQALRQTYYKETRAIVLVFDITDQESFATLETTWLPQIQASVSNLSNVRLCLVGNKTDQPRCVTTEEACRLALKYEMDYMELSALTASVEERAKPFILLAARLIDGKLVERQPVDTSRLRLKESDLLLLMEDERHCC